MRDWKREKTTENGLRCKTTLIVDASDYRLGCQVICNPGMTESCVRENILAHENNKEEKNELD